MLKSQAGDLLRHARWSKGWSIHYLAKEADVAPNTIVKVEKGETIDGKKVYALAKALGLNGADLFEDVPA